jgi:trimethylamine--corrinoid protein Co-methyltransferase
MMPSLKILNDEEIFEIHIASLQILERTGVRFFLKQALEILEDGGAKVDYSNQIARIPAHMVESALSKCSPMVILYGRDGSPPVQIGGRRVHFGTVGFGTYTLDWKTGKYREVVYEDLEEIARLSETLDQVHFVLPPATPQDVDKTKTDLFEFKGCLMNTRKPLIPQALGASSVGKMVDMAAECVGGHDILREKPIFSVIFVITSPLTVREDIAETIIECARLTVPIYMGTGPMGGGNSPCSVCGTVALANAEILSGIVLAKLINPAVPIIYATWARNLDLRSGNVAFGAPEFGMIRIATTQMAQYYHLPSAGGGIICDSKMLDVQMGYEKMATALLPALGGTNMILGMGLIASENTISLEQLVADDEIASYVMRVLKGIIVDDDHLAVDLIDKMGPGGSFIQDEHTFKYFKQEYWIPNVTDRTLFNIYTSPEGKSHKARVRRRIEERMGSYKPLDHHKKIEKALDDIINR